MSKLIYLLGISVLLFSCQNKVTEEQEKTEPKEPLELYIPSEMALLMEQMYTHNLQLKHQITNDGELGEYPEQFDKIHTAEFTDPTDNDSFFQEQAQIYIEYQKDIYQSDNPEKAFNQMVDACIQCHQVKCGGPITRIKKLYISR